MLTMYERANLYPDACYFRCSELKFLLIFAEMARARDPQIRRRQTFRGGEFFVAQNAGNDRRPQAPVSRLIGRHWICQVTRERA